MKSRARQFRRGAFLLILSACAFLPFVGARDIVTSHEGRVYQVARQMAAVDWPLKDERIEVPRVELRQVGQVKEMLPAADGSMVRVNPWLVPVINGQIRLQKPPLPYWCAAILFKLIGTSEWAARIVPATLGFVSVFLVWGIGKRLLGNVGGFYAAIIWCTSYFIIDEYRKAMADPYLAFFALLALWAWMRWRDRRRTGSLMLFYLALAFAILAKGPVVFAFVPVMLIALALFRPPRRRSFISIGPHVAGIVLMLLIALPWFVAIYRTIPNTLDFWRYESVGELSDNTEKARQWWFYLPNLLLITLPWTPVFAMGLVYPFLRLARKRFAPLAATILIVAFFSFAYVKKNAYLLPMMPLAALIGAQGLLWTTIIFRKSPKHRPIAVSVRRTALIGAAFVVIVQFVVSGVITWNDNRRSPRAAGTFVSTLIKDDPHTSLLVSALPEEASVYLPMMMRDARTSQHVLMIADDRKGEAQAAMRAVKSTPAGRVIGRTNVPVPETKNQRWKVYRLTIDPSDWPTSQPETNVPSTTPSVPSTTPSTAPSTQPATNQASPATRP